MNISMEFSQKFASAYALACKPLCRELSISQTALDILLFLANNPDYQTATDIVEIRHIKPSLVSINVDRLVSDGLLRRESVASDRRKTRLVLTDASQTIVARGRAVQENFFERLFDGMSRKQREAFDGALGQMTQNLDAMLEGGAAK